MDRMTKPHETWTVLPHGTLTSLEENLMTVTGTVEMPFGRFERRMTIARPGSGDLVVFSPIALAEEEMQKIEAFGRPAYLVVPNEIHRLDVKPWKQRYPQMKVITPRGSVEKVEEVLAVEGTSIDTGDPAVRYVTVSGTGEHEAALIVQSNGGTSLVINELIFNVPNRAGFGGWLFKLMGITGDEPHMPGVVRMREVKDKPALAAQLAEWSSLPSLKRVLVSHGNIIAEDPRGVLARIATELAD